LLKGTIMGFRIEATGEYFPTDHALRDHLRGSAEVPIPINLEWMEANGIQPVFEGPQASGGTVYQYSQSDGIEQIDGKWYTKYVLGPIFTDNDEATAVEQEAAYKAMKDAERAKSVRTTRNDMLKECDWVVIKAVDQNAQDSLGIQVPVVWLTYRQALRDVTAQSGFPWNVVWPKAPEA
jgi:hypothetical protein